MMKNSVKLLVVAAFLVAIIVVGGYVLGAMSGNGSSSKPQVAGQIELQAGQWKTWVLASASEVRAPAPPDRAATDAELKELKALASQRDDAARNKIAYWDAGSPSYRWVEIALNQLQKKPFSNPRNQRALALLNTAIYDAMVTAWDAKYTYNRPRPSEADATLIMLVATPRSPSYPSEHAVAAGAAAAVLAYLYPDDAKMFNDLADEAAQSRVLAGVQYPSDAKAGLELGRAVAAKVIERAKNDGSDAKWTGTVPTGAGLWNGTNPIEPLAGTWKPYVLSSGNQLRPPAPPAYDSAQKLAELNEIKTFTRTFNSNASAMFWQTFDGIYGTWYSTAHQRITEYHLDTNPPRAARVYALLSVAHYDALVACWDAKYAYWAIRPFQLDKEVTTLFPMPNHPSYPAAHGCVSGGIAAALEYLFPAEAKAIHARADDAATSRIWAGIHYRSDVDAGLALGRAVAQQVVERAKQDGSQSTTLR